MEEFHNDSVFDLSPPQSDEHKVWSLEEDKQFEKAIAELDHSSPTFFEKIASRVPSKSIEDAKIHYQALVEDVDMIEAGLIEPPQYKDDQRTTRSGQGSSSSQDITRRGIPWTEEEHRLFLKGLEKYGKGDWRSISRYCVLTRTPTQVASHAQKYFRRLQSSIPSERRRPSIHDIQNVTTDTTITTIASVPPPASKN